MSAVRWPPALVIALRLEEPGALVLDAATYKDELPPLPLAAVVTADSEAA